MRDTAGGWHKISSPPLILIHLEIAVDYIMTTIRELPIYQTRSKYIELKHTRYIFARNYQELRAFLSNSQEEWLNSLGNDSAKRHQLLETARLVHNFVASAMMLKDHSNRVAEKVFSDKPLKMYEKKATETFRDNTTCGFIQELRNYTLHRNLPITGLSVHLSNITQSATTYLFLDKSALLEWSKWQAKGKIFLKNQPDEIPIEGFSTEYYEIVRDFHKWMETHFESVYSKELKSLFEIINKVASENFPSRARENLIQQYRTTVSDLLTD